MPAITRVLASALLVASVGARAAQDGPTSFDRLTSVRADIDDGYYARAEQGARVVVAEFEQRGGVPSPALADAVLFLAEALRFSDRVLGDEALATAERAVELARALPGDDRERVAASLLNLGHLRYMRDEYDDARTTLEASLAMDTAESEVHARAGFTLSLLASLAFEQTNDRAAAEALFERAREIQAGTLGEEHRDVGFRHLQRGNVAHSASDYATARDEYERALSIWRKVLRPDHPLIARALNNLGNPLSALHDYAGARTCFREALALRIQAYGPEHRHVASTLNNLARVELALNDAPAAREHWQRALEIEERAGGSRSAKCQIYLCGIGDCAYREAAESRAKGNEAAADVSLAQAAHVFSRAISIEEERSSRDSPELVTRLVRLANVRYGQGALVAATELYERAERLLAAGDGSDVYERACLAMSQAELALAQGNAAGARERLAPMLELVAQKLGDDAPIYAMLLDRMARVQADLGDHDTAVALELSAEAIAREQLLDTARVLDDGEYMAFGADRSAYLNRAVVLARASTDRARVERTWDALARSRGLVFEELAERSRLTRESTDPEVRSAAHRLAAARDELARWTVRGPNGLSPDEFRARFDDARAEKRGAEDDLARLDGRLRARSRQRDASLEQLRGALPPSAALISYVRCSPELGATVYLAISSWPARATATLRDLGDAGEIDDLVARTLSSARVPGFEGEYRAVAAKLRQRIWDPVATELAGCDEIFVVPDGALSVLNFAALPTGDSTYLVETAPAIRNLCTERDLAPRADAPRGHGLLALGGVSFDSRAPLLAQAGVTPGSDGAIARSTAVTLPASYAELSFGALPGSARELDIVKALWLDAAPASAADPALSLDEIVTLTGAGATEANFKRAAPGRSVLHLATHGFVVANEHGSRPVGARGVSPLRPSTVIAQELPLEPSRDPLLLSGLAFAGANHRGDAQDSSDDGILTAEEIASLDLSSVDCAVLSACDSGLGEIASGEGVFGLRRAFQLAGVRSLVVSLWPVDDETTGAWMTELYKAGLARGSDPADAVRSASIATLAARRRGGLSVHPYYWCAFTAIGTIREPHVPDSTSNATTGRCPHEQE